MKQAGTKTLTLMQRMEKAGHTQQSLAKATGIGPTSVHFHVHGRIPNLHDGLAYSRFFKCSPDAILKGYEQSEGAAK